MQINFNFNVYKLVFLMYNYFVNNIKEGIMSKVKILKKLPKSKTKYSKSLGKVVPHDKASSNSFADKYLQFYDDIKINSKRNDW